VPLFLRANPCLVLGTVGVAATANLNLQAHQSLQGSDGPLSLERGPERPTASGATPRVNG
jgi:hypothetical protein